MIAGVQQPRPHLRGDLVRDHAGRGGTAREQDVHGHRGSGEIRGDHARQRLDAGARRSVGDEPAASHRLLVHRDHHDPAAARGQHPRSHRSHHQERPRHLRLDDVAKPAGRDLPERSRVGHEPRVDAPHADPGVTDQHVKASEPLVNGLHTRLNRRLIPHVQLDPDRADLLRGRLRTRPVTAGQRDAGAGGGQRGGHRPAETARASGHQDPCGRQLRGGHTDGGRSGSRVSGQRRNPASRVGWPRPSASRPVHARPPRRVRATTARTP